MSAFDPDMFTSWLFGLEAPKPIATAVFASVENR